MPLKVNQGEKEVTSPKSLLGSNTGLKSNRLSKQVSNLRHTTFEENRDLFRPSVAQLMREKTVQAFNQRKDQQKISEKDAAALKHSSIIAFNSNFL